MRWAPDQVLEEMSQEQRNEQGGGLSQKEDECDSTSFERAAKEGKRWAWAASPDFKFATFKNVKEKPVLSGSVFSEPVFCEPVFRKPALWEPHPATP